MAEEIAVKYKCRGWRGKDVPGFEKEMAKLEAKEQDKELAKRRTEYLGKERVGCGQDITKLIVAMPHDGKDHEIECPRCGHVSVNHTTPPATEEGGEE